MMFASFLAETAYGIVRRPTKARLWGDGFASDGIDSILRVSLWDEVETDEFLRLYPGLVGKPERRLRTYIERCVATVFSLSKHEDRGALLHLSSAHVQGLVKSHRPHWSPAPTPFYIHSLSLAVLKSLEDFLIALEAGQTPPYGQKLAEYVAFHTGVHPAYFWREAAVNHQLFTTLGWLGVVMRGRPALMPFDVAEDLSEVIDGCSDDTRLTVLGSRNVARIFLQQAKRRLLGYEVVFRPSQLSRWRSAPLDG